MKIDQYQTAIDHYQKAEKIALEYGDKRLECEALISLGNTYQRIGEYQTAIENYHKAEKLALERRDKRQECEAYRSGLEIPIKTFIDIKQQWNVMRKLKK